MIGKAGIAPCGHQGEHVTVSYVQCLRCDAGAKESAETSPPARVVGVGTILRDTHAQAYYQVASVDHHRVFAKHLDGAYAAAWPRERLLDYLACGALEIALAEGMQFRDRRYGRVYRIEKIHNAYLEAKAGTAPSEAWAVEVTLASIENGHLEAIL